MRFDPICFSKINELLESGGVGKIKTSTLTFGGSIAGEDVFGSGIAYTKISDNPLDLAAVKRLSVFWKGNRHENTFDYLKEDFYIADDGNIAVLSVQNPDNPSENVEDWLWAVISVYGIVEGVEVEQGLYVLNATVEDLDSHAYISRIDYETVHPIDPKYLPGVCLPVVEITSGIVSMEENYSLLLSETEVAQVKAVFESGSPAIVKFPMCLYAGGDIFPAAVLFNNFTFALCGYAALAVDVPAVFTIAEEENGWAIKGNIKDV